MLKTHVERVLKNLYLLRVDDDQIRYFEAIWKIEDGITYNSYLLINEGEVILIDGWKKKYADEHLETLKSLVDVKDITHVIIHHMEPDHSGSLGLILKENGFKAEVLGHPLVKNMMKTLYGIDVKFRAIRDGENLLLGSLALKFFHTPWLHWPETIMTLLKEESLLLSGDAFGGFSIPEAIFDDSEEVISHYLPSVRKYVAAIIGAYRAHIIKNIDKLSRAGISPKIIAPAHGLIWKKKPEVIIDYYRRLARGEPDGNKILIISGSMYGLTEKAAEVALEEAYNLGCRVAYYRFNDLEHASLVDIIGDAIDSKAIIIAAPTYEAGVYPLVEQVVRLISKKIPPKPVLVISSYGWAGVAAKSISEVLSKAGFKILDAIEFQGSASEADLERIKTGVRGLIGLSGGEAEREK